MDILIDIGGTYARFAVKKRGKPDSIKKIAAADFKNFEDAVADYVHGVKAGGDISLLISTAAHTDGRIWRFVNNNKWIIDPDALKKCGFSVQIILNDFEAATWGLIGIKDREILKNPLTKNENDTVCLIGPGTGLGLAYLRGISGRKHAVQKTMGGHIAAAAVTPEQEKIIESVRALKPRPGMVVYEDLISGQGLINIYNAICQRDGKMPLAQSAEKLVESRASPQIRAALRLFHEFFGVFASGAAVAGDSFGGLYLMGGVVDRLVERGLFDFKSFEKFFIADTVPSVRTALDSTPVYRVTDPYIALKGLIKAAHA
jgi:glucokinase